MTKHLTAAAYLGSIVAAAYAVTHVGTQYDPHGPHVVPVWPGIEAPSGVYLIGLTLVLRDLLQRQLPETVWVDDRGLFTRDIGSTKWGVSRKVVMFALIAVGAGLSALVSPAVALASGAAFLISESLDYGTFSFVEPRWGFVPGVLASNAVSIVADSLVFLAVAFGSLAFIEGQIIGKAIATLAAVVVIAGVRVRQAVAA